jgi:hypothetical protein
MQLPTLTKTERQRCYLDPVEFQRVALGRRLWGAQRQMLRALETKRHIAVKGCHSSGKTFAAAGAVLWWLTRHQTGKVITTAPTMRQVKLMWSEIALARNSSNIVFPEPSVVGLKISEERYGLGISSSRGVNIQGFHGSHVLIIADEAPGIEQDIWDSIEGIRSGGQVTLLELGNPTISSGHFFDNFGRGRAACECITISAFDSPNLAGLTMEQLLELPDDQLDISPWPLLIQRRWVKDRWQRWGPNNPRFVSRVLGEFPTQAERAVFSLEWIERARREPTELELARANGSLIQVGIDVAGPGDDETAGCARVNGIVIARQAWPDKDPRGAVMRWLHQLRVSSGYQLGTVVVDIVGIGYNFGLHLADLGFEVMGFNAGYAAMDREQFINAKAEAYFRRRDMYRENYVSHLSAALDEETEAQLSAIEYEETSRGLIKIESKEDARKRGVTSPDRAEAEVMAFCQVVPRQQRVELGSIYQISPI